MKTLLFTLANIIILTTTLSSQTDCTKWTLGLHYNLIKPLDQLHLNGYRFNHGGNAELFRAGLSKGKVQVQPGLKVNLGTSRSNKETVELVVPENGIATAHSHNMVLDLTGSLRFIVPTEHSWSFYGDMNVGGRRSWARETIKPDEDTQNFENAKTDYYETTSFLYGVNLGILIPMNEKVDLDIRGNYEACSLMNHFDLNTTEYAQVKTADPKDIGLEIGIRIKLGCNEKSQEEKRRHRITTPTRPKTKVIKKSSNTVKT